MKTHEDLILKESDTSEDKIERLQFIKLPTKNGREQKEFEKMLGHTYEAYYSSFGKGYVIIGCDTEAASKAFEDTVYKTLIAAGEDEDFAKACAYEGEDPEMCLYIPKKCFVKVKE